MLAIISPEEARANAPPAPPSGIAAGSPTTERAEAKLALEIAVEMMLELSGTGICNFLGTLIFFHNASIMENFCVQSS